MFYNKYGCMWDMKMFICILYFNLVKYEMSYIFFEILCILIYFMYIKNIY